MSEFQLTNLESTDISGWNFSQVKDYLATALERYDGIVYADEDSAKADKKELTKLTKLIDDRRKAYKKQCLQPYEELEPQIKALLAMIEERQRNIDGSVKVFEEKRKASRESEIKAYYDTKAVSLGALAEPLYKRIFSPKWLNASASLKKTEEEIQLAISRVSGELEQIRALKSPYIDTLVENYTGGAAIEDCFKKNEELTAAHEKAGFEDSGTAKSVVRSEIAQNASSDAGITLTIKGDKRQLEQVFDFMRAIGVEFEIK